MLRNKSFTKSFDMIIFSNSKINLGLWILSKRDDRFHNISTIFYPILWHDVIEIIPNYSMPSDINIYVSGINLNIDKKENLIYKAYQIITQKYPHLPYMDVYLHKNIPHGAGLGAGSANAAYFIKACNELLNLNLSEDAMKKMAGLLGADCSFFIENKPVIASGKGDILSPINVNLSSYYLLVVYPNISISTKYAYSKITPKLRAEKLEDIIQLPITDWKKYLTNDFENFVFQEFSLIEKIKNTMYENNALYSSLSGSGSAVYGIFDTKPPLNLYTNYKYYLAHPPNYFSS